MATVILDIQTRLIRNLVKKFSILIKAIVMGNRIEIRHLSRELLYRQESPNS